MKKVTLIEEVSPEQGCIREKIEKGIWNSPPPEKGQGRYRIVGKTIEKGDFGKLGAKYWNEEFLEECDMFYDVPGWRIDISAIETLKNLSYDVEIDMIEAQKERAARKKEKEEAQKKAEREAQEKNEYEYKKAVQKFEAFLGNPQYRERTEGEEEVTGQYVHRIQSKNATIYNDEYTSYCLLEDGRVFSHRHYNSDWGNNIITVRSVPANVQKWFREKQKELNIEEEKREKETERKRQERRQKIKEGFLKMLERTTWEKIELTLKKINKKRFCPCELSKNGRVLYGDFSIEEAKKIVGEK